MNSQPTASATTPPQLPFRRRLTLLDRLLCEVDAGLRVALGEVQAARAVPLPELPVDAPTASVDAAATQESVRLMRVNHVGEVCAQALYQGQALVARNPSIRGVLQHAGEEERDHLAWCATRVHELGGRTSVLSPMFYVGAWTLGVASGLAGDKWSMGFLVETERQVEAHLNDHLERISPTDTQSRAIVEQMRADEIAHGNSGEAHGAAALPQPIKFAMKLSSKLMTSTSYWV
jgi:3-demethoxyubiquinol 3-hydroxylase